MPPPRDGDEKREREKVSEELKLLCESLGADCAVQCDDDDGDCGSNANQ